MLRGFVTAVRTLTIVPLPGRDADRFASSLPWFPLVGALLGTVVALGGMAVYAATSRDWPELAALVAVAVSAYLTRALHLDGIADVADATGAIRDRERALRIMKDPTVGAFGVIALVIVLLTQWAAISRLVAQGAAPWIVVAFVWSRAAQVVLASSLPYARVEGGTAGSFVDGARIHHAVAAIVFALICAGIVGGAPGAVMVVPAVLIAIWWRRWCRTRFGGITGDLLGAGSVIVETLLLVVSAAFGSHIIDWVYSFGIPLP